MQCFAPGLSDFYKLTLTALKVYFQKQKPKVIKYRNYKKFDNNLFRKDLLNELLSKNVQTKHLIHLRLYCSFNTLIESDKGVTDKRRLVKIFNEFISNNVSDLDIQRPPNITVHHDPVLNAKKKKKENHASIVEIKNKFRLM